MRKWGQMKGRNEKSFERDTMIEYALWTVVVVVGVRGVFLPAARVDRESDTWTPDVKQVIMKKINLSLITFFSLFL